jgi:hypothetical protein
VAEASAPSAASEETETKIVETPGETAPVVETQSEASEEPTDVRSSTNENS